MRNLSAAIFHLLFLFSAQAVLGEDSGNKPASTEKAGFGSQVASQLQEMAGTWEILEAKMLGALLPKDQFESLKIDSSGFTLHVQKRQTGFEFISYDLDEDVFLARSRKSNFVKTPLFYEVILRDGVVTIRYQVNGATKRPDKDATDSQRLVQKWIKRKMDKEAEQATN